MWVKANFLRLMTSLRLDPQRLPESRGLPIVVRRSSPQPQGLVD